MNIEEVNKFIRTNRSNSNSHKKRRNALISNSKPITASDDGILGLTKNELKTRIIAESGRIPRWSGHSQQFFINS